MLPNIFVKTVRDYWKTLLFWGGGLALIILGSASAYDSLFGGPNKAKLIAEYTKAVSSFTFLTGPIADMDTLGGYLTTRLMGILPVMLGILALLMGSALIRGEEEKGSLDLLLSTPHSRTSVLLQKWAGMAVVLGLLSGISWLGLVIGATNSTSPFNAGTAAIAFLNVALITLVYGTLALMFGQLLDSRKAAAGWTGGILAATYLMNSMADSAPSLGWMRYLSPFHYYTLSKPMAVSVGTNWLGLLVLAVLSVGLVTLAVVMYLQRDHNNVFQLFQHEKVVKSKEANQIAEPASPWLTSSFLFALRTALPGVVIWGLGIAVYVVIMMSVLNDIRDVMLALLDNDIYKQVLGFGASRLASNENVLGLLLFVFLIILCAAYAVTQVASWASEENDGRLELVLSAPLPRWRLLLLRFIVALLTSALMVGLVGLVFALCTVVFNTPVNSGNAVAAFFGLWVICVVIAAGGYVLAAFGPGWAVAMLSGLVVISYLADLLASLLKLPDWLVNLSVFRQYGRPMLNGIDWTTQLIILGLSLVFVTAAIFRFEQRDITK